MKRIRIFISFMLSLLLTACAADSASESTAPSEIDTPAAQTSAANTTVEIVALDTAESGDESSAESGDAESELIGVCGEVFDAASFEERPDYVLDMYLYNRVDYGYAAYLGGKTYNSSDDPDKFYRGEHNWECTEKSEAVSGDYFIVNKGDNIGGLTCTDCYAEYYINTVSSLYDYFGLMYESASFDGEIEVTGYVECYEGIEGYVTKGELAFYPDSESWQGLPIPYNSYYQIYRLNNNEMLIYAPFRISLGTIYDYPSLGLENEIPENSTARVKLVLKDLQLNFTTSSFGQYAKNTATVVSAEIID